MTEATSLTLNEAGYVVGQSSAAINRAVDRGTIDAEICRSGGHAFRTVGRAELRSLAVMARMARDLTPAGRRRVYEAVRLLPAGAQRVDLGVIELKLADVDRGIAERLDRLRSVRASVEAAEGGEFVLRGTAVPVYALSALAAAQGVTETARDFPSLTVAQIEAAVEYAAIYPRPGRPLPTHSFRRLLADAAAAGAWDADDEAGPAAPRAP